MKCFTMKRFFTVLVVLIASLSLSAQTKDVLDFGNVIMATAFEDGQVFYKDEVMPQKFMSYLIIGEKKIFITSEFFDKRLEIPYETYSEIDNDHNFTSYKTRERVTVNLTDYEVYYFKYNAKTDEVETLLIAKIDPVKSLALVDVLKR